MSVLTVPRRISFVSLKADHHLPPGAVSRGSGEPLLQELAGGVVGQQLAAGLAGGAVVDRVDVYKRQGETCPVCSDTVRAVEYRSYTVNYCATCQTGGKVLADNTTSKFLK